MYSENLSVIHLDANRTVPTRVDYTSFDPYSIHLQFTLPNGTYVNWEFARDLLLSGMVSEPWVGLGDVRVCRADEDYLALRVDVDGVTATFLFPIVEISRFVGRTLQEMPLGDELIDTDALATAE